MDEQKERALRKEAARLVTGKRTVTLRDWIDTGIAVDWADDQTATSVNVHGRLSRDAERIRELETILARCATALTRVSCQIDDLEDEDRMDAVDAADDARALLTRAEHAETSHCEHCDDDPAKCDPDETGGCACCCHESNRPDDTISRLRADLARVTGERDAQKASAIDVLTRISRAVYPGNTKHPAFDSSWLLTELEQMIENGREAAKERDEARGALAQLAAATERAEKAEAREGELTAELRRLWGVVCDEDAAAIEAHIGLVGAEPAAVCEVHNRRLSSA